MCFEVSGAWMKEMEMRLENGIVMWELKVAERPGENKTWKMELACYNDVGS